jgi:hypothetical protein
MGSSDNCLILLEAQKQWEIDLMAIHGVAFEDQDVDHVSGEIATRRG